MALVETFYLGNTKIEMYDDYCKSPEESLEIVRGLSKYFQYVKKDAVIPAREVASYRTDNPEELSKKL